MFPSFEATKRFELIEIQVPANYTKTTITIPDQPDLRTDQDADIIIQGIEVYDVLGIPVTVNNFPVVTQADMQKSFLTLYIDQEESIYRLPFISMKRIANEAATSPFVYDLFKFRNVAVDWTKSYIAAGTAWAQTAFSFLLGIHYYKLPPGTMARVEEREQAIFLNP